MKWIALFVAFNVSTDVWAASEDESEDAETEEATPEARAAEARALELLGGDPGASTPEQGFGTDALLESARSDLGDTSAPTLPMEPTPPLLEETIEVSVPLRQETPEVIEEQPLARPPAKKRRVFGPTSGQYASGRRLSKQGFVMGGLGTAVAIGGIYLFESSLYSGDGGGVILGFLALVGGGGSVWVGAGVTAAGTYRSHSALVKSGLASPVCVGCVGAWVTVASPFTVPYSYLISAAQISVDARKHSAKARARPRSSGIQISPVLTRSGPGLGVKGAF